MFFCRTFLPLATLCLSGCALLVSSPAFATTYTTYVTSPDNQGNVDNIGITTSGSLVLFTAASTNAYTLFTPPSTFTNLGTTDPAFTYDNGVSCAAPTMTGFLTSQGVCNGSYEVFSASANQLTGIYVISSGNPIASLLYPVGHYGPSGFLLDSRGDVATTLAGGSPTGGDRNVFFVASAPEPSSIALMATGLLSTAAMVRRRQRSELPLMPVR